MTHYSKKFTEQLVQESTLLSFGNWRLEYVLFPNNRKLSAESRVCSRWQTGLKRDSRKGKSEWTALLRPFLPKHFVVSLSQRNSNLPKPRDGALNRRRSC